MQRCNIPVFPRQIERPFKPTVYFRFVHCKSDSNLGLKSKRGRWMRDTRLNLLFLRNRRNSSISKNEPSSLGEGRCLSASTVSF